MIPDQIERDVLIDAPVETVWRAVTEPDQIAQWFVHEAELDARPGGEGRLTFVTDDNERVAFRVSVRAVEPPRRFSFRWVHPEGEDATETNSVLVELTLTPEGKQTRLQVSERGMHLVAWPDDRKAQYVAEHTEGWEGILDRLAAYAPSRAGVSA